MRVQGESDSNRIRPFRVLSLDGGGMRGTYTATYLSCLEQAFARRRKVNALDVGAGFDLITGTSTGGIIACAMAYGTPLQKIIQLYRTHGSAIFPRRLPNGMIGVAIDHLLRSGCLEAGENALRSALEECFGATTLAELFESRGIALAIPAIELSQHRSWVFKTPHLIGKTNRRDDAYPLVDVCLATSAAPLFRSIAAIGHLDASGSKATRMFVDGGLWANNPVLVGLIDALELAGPGRDIEIFCIGTCPRPEGELISKSDVHRNLRDWKFGGLATALAIDAQEFAFDNMARMLAKHLSRECSIIRFPREDVPAALMSYLDLDDTRDDAIKALINQATLDANMANSRCGDENCREGQLIGRLFMDLPVATESGRTEKKGDSNNV